MLKKWLVKWQIHRKLKKINRFVFFYVNLKNVRTYIEVKRIIRIKKKNNKLYKQLTKINLDDFKRFINVVVLKEKVELFLQYYLSIDEHYKKINNEISNNEDKANQFFIWVDTFKTKLENNLSPENIKSQYLQLSDYIKSGDKKKLKIFFDFIRYYDEIDSYTVLWEKIRTANNQIHDLFQKLTSIKYVNNYKIDQIISDYLKVFQFTNSVEKKEIHSDYLTSIKQFIETYPNLDKIIHKNNITFLDEKLKQRFINALNQNRYETSKKENLFVTNLIRELTVNEEIPVSEIVSYFNLQLSKIDNRFEYQIHQLIVNETNYKIISNIYLKTFSEYLPYTQIDHIIIGGGRVLIIEAKDYVGKIYGSYQKDYWKQRIVNHYSYKNSYKTYTKVHKEEFRSPIKQNKWHIDCLKNIYDLNYQNIVVFSDRAELFVPVSYVINYKNLLNYLNTQNNNEYQQAYLNEFYYRLLLLNEGNNPTVKNNHIKSIQQLHR